MNRSTVSAFIRSKRITLVLKIMGAFVIALFIFQAGVAVGIHKASFAYHWQKNYDRNFGAPGMFDMGVMRGPNPHGAAGEIISVSESGFTIAGGKEPEKIILVDEKTIIRDAMIDSPTLKDISPGMFAIVLGDPNNEQGEVHARFVRIMPPPPGNMGTSTVFDSQP
ncbi:MAG: hypothetical protein WAV21_00830 [Minisyncoccia bacterium]